MNESIEGREGGIYPNFLHLSSVRVRSLITYLFGHLIVSIAPGKGVVKCVLKFGSQRKC